MRLKSMVKWALGEMRALALGAPELPPGADKAEGPEGIRQLGHRGYVGGNWEHMQQLQFRFMLAQGLRPAHHLWDVGCGSLRAGVPLIGYLEPGHYHGMERHAALLELGIEHELGRDAFQHRRPDLVASETFEFDRFDSPAPDFVLAQSLFTHIPPALIELCLGNLRRRAKPSTVFFTSFKVVPLRTTNALRPHDHGGFFYTVRELERMGGRHGWQGTYVGDWNHPNSAQVMMSYRPQ